MRGSDRTCANVRRPRCPLGQRERELRESRRQIRKRIQSDILVPVLLACQRGLGVVDVHPAEVRHADVALELGHWGGYMRWSERT